MKTIKNTLILLMLVTTYSAFGQAANIPSKETHYIEVLGTKQLEIVPDEIYIGIEIEEKHLDKTKITILEQEEKLKTSLKFLGIDLVNLSLSDANSNYVNSRWSWQSKNELISREYVLKVSDAAMVGKVFTELDNVNTENVYILRVNHSKLEALKKDARIEAIKNAKEKADYLLLAIGEQTGKPLIVSENIPQTYNAGNEYLYTIEENKRVSGRKQSGKHEELQFTKMKISINIYVKFEIK